MDFGEFPVLNCGDYWVAHLPGDDSLKMRGSTPEEAREKMKAYLNHLIATLDLYSLFIKEGDICFDVGANRGERTAVFRKLGAKVIAVEPQSKAVRELNDMFKGYNDVVVVPAALGESEGELEMMLGSEDTVSTLSKEWVEKVKDGRFSNIKWDSTETVKVTTLDNLIKTYGKPAFIKIDVEGYEDHVIKGLTSPVNAVSMEFITEFPDPVFNSIRHLASLGKTELNFSFAESMKLELDKWIPPEEMIQKLESLDKNKMFWGDVYIRFV